MSENITTFVCANCGSDHCGYDATAHHDPVTGDWVLGSMYDSTWCNDCGEVNLKEVVLTKEDADTARTARAGLVVMHHAMDMLSALEELMADLKRLSAEHPICHGVLKSSYGVNAQQAIDAARGIQDRGVQSTGT